MATMGIQKSTLSRQFFKDMYISNHRVTFRQEKDELFAKHKRATDPAGQKENSHRATGIDNAEQGG